MGPPPAHPPSPRGMGGGYNVLCVPQSIPRPSGAAGAQHVGGHTCTRHDVVGPVAGARDRAPAEVGEAGVGTCLVRGRAVAGVGGNGLHVCAGGVGLGSIARRSGPWDQRHRRREEKVWPIECRTQARGGALAFLGNRARAEPGDGTRSGLKNVRRKWSKRWRYAGEDGSCL